MPTRVPDMTALTAIPVAPFTTEPKWARTPALRALGHNGSWADDLSPATTMRKLVGYSVEYAASHAWGTQKLDGSYHLLCTKQASGNYVILDYLPGTGASNERPFPNPQPRSGGLLLAAMSSVDPAVCYAVCTDLKLHKFQIGTSSITDVVGGVWPKSLAAFADFAGAGTVPAWLRHDYADAKFSLSSDTLDTAWVWNSTTDALTSLTGATLRADGSIPGGWSVNEAYITLDGGWVSVALSPGDNVVWDLTTGFHSKLGPHFSHGQVIDGGIWAPYWWNRPGALADLTITQEGRGYSLFAPITANGQAHPNSPPVHTELTGIYSSTYEGTYDHATTFWRQQSTAAANRWVFGAQSAGLLWTLDGSNNPIPWTADTGNVWKRQPSTNWTIVPLRVLVECDGSNAATGKLTKVANRAALVSAGQWCLDAGWVYVWRSDSAAVTYDNVALMAGGATAGAIGTQTVGRSAAKHIAWHYEHPNSLTYPEERCGNVNQDGSLMLVNSDLGQRGGTMSLLVAELPITGGGTADHLDVVQQPGGVVSGVPMTQPLVVHIEDVGNATVTGDSSTVTVALVVESGVANATGLLSRNAASGSVTFADLGCFSAQGAVAHFTVSRAGLVTQITQSFPIVPRLRGRRF